MVRRLTSLFFAALLLALCVFAPALSEDAVPAWEKRVTLHAGFDPDRPVPDETVQRLLRAALSMPTGGDQAALRFHSVESRDTMRRMQEGHPYASALSTAPLVIVVSGDMADAYYPELLEMDAGLAAGAILMEAADRSLATCVLSISPQEKRIKSVRAALSLPETLRPILMVAVGFPPEDARTSASVRPLDDVSVTFVPGEEEQ